MTEYLTEQEQIELLKRWVKQYAFVIIAGVALAMLAISGWRYWQQRQMKRLTHASAVYDDMLTMRAQNDAAATLVQAEKLFAHYKNTVYGQMAAFTLARHAVLKQDYHQAQKQLTWVIDNSKISAMRQIARLRLARVYLAEKQAEKGLKTLSKVEDQQFAGLIDELRGDIYLSQQKTSEAKQAYQQALKELPNADSIRPLLQMKYDNLATTTTAA